MVLIASLPHGKKKAGWHWCVAVLTIFTNGEPEYADCAAAARCSRDPSVM
jgi:hypothetical protein